MAWGVIRPSRTGCKIGPLVADDRAAAEAVFAALVAAVSDHVPGAVLEGVDAGLHVVLRLPDEVDDLELVTALEARGVAVSPLSAYGIEVTLRGLVLCYAGLPESQAAAAVRRIAEVVRSA